MVNGIFHCDHSFAICPLDKQGDNHLPSTIRGELEGSSAFSTVYSVIEAVKSLEDIMTGCAEVSEMESQSWQAAFLPSEEVC